MRNFLLVFILLVVVLSGIASAAPVLPEEFYGYLSLNGNPAPAGTIIVAKINGETRGMFTTTSPGQYGGSGNFDPRLVVTSTDEEISAGTASIVFFVDGVQAFQVAPFQSGNSERLDLVANTRAFTGDTASGSSSQSGSVSGGSGSGTTVSGGGASYSSGGSTAGVSSSSPQSYSTAATTGASVSRSSIYYSETTAITQGTTIKATPPVTALPNTTSVPATTKAGFGAISAILFAGAIIGTLACSARVCERK